MTGGRNWVALITGAAGGIGAAIAQRLAGDGHAVAIVDIKDGRPVADRIGGEAEFFNCDVSNPEVVEELGRAVERRFGRCDILVNNAGWYEPRRFDELTYEHWRNVMAVNLDAMFLTVKAFAPAMRARKWGRIVNMVSNSTLLAPAGMPQYIAAKSGAIGLARALATEFGRDGVTVNAVAPGPIDTAQPRAAYAAGPGGGSEAGFEDFMAFMVSNQAVKRGGKPKDVAGLVAFLASDDAEFITSQTIVVDGGWARV